MCTIWKTVTMNQGFECRKKVAIVQLSDKVSPQEEIGRPERHVQISSLRRSFLSPRCIWHPLSRRLWKTSQSSFSRGMSCSERLRMLQCLQMDVFTRNSRSAVCCQKSAARFIETYRSPPPRPIPLPPPYLLQCCRRMLDPSCATGSFNLNLI